MKDVVVFNRQGFTLVELTLAVALLSIILTSFIAFYFWGLRVFNNGIARAELQQNVRIAADYISRELRFAESLELAGAQKVSYFKPQDGNRYVLKKKGREIVVLINGVENKVASDIAELSLKMVPGKNLLVFEVVGNDGRFNYGIKSSILLKNAGEGGGPL